MKTKFLGLLIAGIISAPFTALANSDNEYPAANFQPKVIFADESAKTSGSATATQSSPDSNFPAANFEPKILYADESVTASASTGEKSVFDPKYPAANFEPKIIYP
jgi:hypothetical protein